MRIIIYGIFFYCLYLLLKFLTRLFIQPRKPKGYTQVRNQKPIDLNKIEEADYEEINGDPPHQGK